MSTLRKQSIAFTQPQAEFLSAEAGRLGISVGELVRRVIDQIRGASAPVAARKPT